LCEVDLDGVFGVVRRHDGGYNGDVDPISADQLLKSFGVAMRSTSSTIHHPIMIQLLHAVIKPNSN